MERRLSTILAADVAGYSRLMENDEEATIRALTIFRQAIDSLVSTHHGRVFGSAGDSIIAEFPSPVEAVRCAMEIQNEVDLLGTSQTINREMRFRIGINLGDVIIDGRNLLGDGVNIAARLEAIAEPGGITIAGSVYDLVKKNLALDYQDLGEQQVKNIAEPVRAYRISINNSSRQGRGTDRLTGNQEKPSIAILPFDNLSGDPEQEYLADGICEDLITALSRIRWFFVIARNSTFTYKGRSVDVTRVAQELGVRYVIEGSVRKAGERVRISAQLIEATTGRHVWAERYDRRMEDIFELQDEITQTIAGAVEPELSAAERERAVNAAPDSLDAWKIFQKGLWHLWRFSREDMKEAQKFLRQAQKMDSRFAPAFAFESYSHFLDTMLGFTDSAEESIDSALQAAKKALSLDEKDPIAYFAMGRVNTLRGNLDAAINELGRSIELSPSLALAYRGLGFALVLSGRYEEASEALDRAVQLSPRDPAKWGTLTYRSMASNLQGNFEEAVEWAEQAVREPRAVDGGYWPHATLASALANLGNVEAGRKELDLAIREKPDISIAYVAGTFPTKHEQDIELFLEGLRKAGLPE